MYLISVRQEITRNIVAFRRNYSPSQLISTPIPNRHLQSQRNPYFIKANAKESPSHKIPSSSSRPRLEPTSQRRNLIDGAILYNTFANIQKTEFMHASEQ